MHNYAPPFERIYSRLSKLKKLTNNSKLTYSGKLIFLLMKKSILLLPLALTIASCSNDTTIGDESSYDGSFETNYLTVNISTAFNDNGPLSRAGSDGETTDYEQGIGNENAVKAVRFYFFDGFGNAANVSKQTGTLLSYLDWIEEDFTDEEWKGDGSNNIELQLKTTLIIQTDKENGDRKPATVVAIINPNDALKEHEVTSLDDLNGFVANYNSGNAVTVTPTEDFVMSNAVYYSSTDQKIYHAIDVTDKMKPTREAANDDPVVIYVERIVAKVRLTMDASLETKNLEDGTILYKTGVADSNLTGDEADDDIYVKLLGWNVTSTPTKSFTVKNIHDKWTSTVLFGDDVLNWSSETRKRSFWAINPTLNYTAEEGDYEFFDFAGSGTVKGFADAKNEDAPGARADEAQNYCYVHENAALSATTMNPAHPSQVIIAAQLVDSNGDPVVIAEWASIRYKKETLLTNLANLANVNKITDGTDNKEYDKLGAEYFEFLTAEEVGKAGFEQPGRYNVYLQLNEEKINDENLKVTIGSEGDAMDPEIINEQLLANITPAKVWEEGNTYYFFNIEHLGNKADGTEGSTDSPAAYGVVRNHIYAANIQSLYGLGTPVFDPSHKIIPEKPSDEDTYIAAQIKVLTWRLVNQGIDLSWPD